MGLFEGWQGRYGRPPWVMFSKVLSATDIGRTRSHGAGLLVPRPVAFTAFPEIHDPLRRNPRVSLVAHCDNLPQDQPLTTELVWYNQRTRNEARMTNLAGVLSPVAQYGKVGDVLWGAIHPQQRQVRFWLEGGK